MRSPLIKQLARICAVLMILATLTSCAKKGTGCPSDFKAPTIQIK